MTYLLEKLCPFCLSLDGKRTELKIFYEDKNLIPVSCPVCKRNWEYKREFRKPSMFARIIEKIKRIGR